MNEANDYFGKESVALALIRAIRRKATRRWRIMEICGGQTHAIARFGLEKLLEDEVEFIHGPGCPVCVTPVGVIDQAIAIACEKNNILVSFGDMLRVPGGQISLLQAKARGADVRIVYSPLDSLQIARENPHRRVVFWAIGFETTAPLHAACLMRAEQLGLENYRLLTSLLLVPPALRLLMQPPSNSVNGILAAGHVCAITGERPYRELCRQIKMPVSITGFELNDLLWGIYNVVDMLENGVAEMVNSYARVVSECGNQPAQMLIEKYFQVSDAQWRGLGMIAQSGLTLRPEYGRYDAARYGESRNGFLSSADICPLGEIMRGNLTPGRCPQFAISCTPAHPKGAAMVSEEGVCSAYYKMRNI